MDNLLINTILYADDIILIADTKFKLQQMLNITATTGFKLQLKFNPEKTNYMGINEQAKIRNKKYDKDNFKIAMDGSEIMRVKSFKYLGNMISEDMKSYSHVNNRIAKATAIAVQIKNKGFVKDACPQTLAQIHKTYLRPVLYYGLEALHLNQEEKRSIKKYETKSVKIGLGLSPLLKTKPLLHALGIDDFTHRMKLMKLNMYARLISNEYTLRFLCMISKVYKRKIPRNSVIYGLIMENTSGLKLEDQAMKCMAKYYNMKKTFKKFCERDETINKIKKLLQDINKNRDELSAILIAF